MKTQPLFAVVETEPVGRENAKAGEAYCLTFVEDGSEWACLLLFVDAGGNILASHVGQALAPAGARWVEFYRWKRVKL